MVHFPIPTLTNNFYPFIIIFYGLYFSIIILVGTLTFLSFSITTLTLTCLEMFILGILFSYISYAVISNKTCNSVFHWKRIRKSKFIDTICDYFSMKGVIGYDSKPRPNEIPQCIFALHPHGVFCFPAFYMLKIRGDFHKLYNKVKTCLLTSSLLLGTPFIRELAIWLGCFDASYGSAKNAIKKGFSPIVTPGGAKESIMTDPKKETIVLNNRKGFIELAIVNGLPVIPVYAFGINKVYQTSNLFQKFRVWLYHKTLIWIPLFWGKYGSCVPYQHNVTLVFGEPVYFPQKDKPSISMISDCHQIYKEALYELYEKHKSLYDEEQKDLKFM